MPEDPRDVLSAWPEPFASARPEPWRVGGWSGARFWRLKVADVEFVLRQWPAEHPDPARLAAIHDVLRCVAAAGFRRIPVPTPTAAQATFVRRGGRLWELAERLPGEPEPAPRSTPARIAAAAVALAEFHRAAASHPWRRLGPSPGLGERRDRLRAYLAGERPRLESTLPATANRLGPAGGEFLAIGRSLLDALDRQGAALLAQLEAAAERVVPLQPCWRDARAENVLFVGDEVGGLVDFGAMRPEHPAGDLARLLGDLADDDPALVALGLAAYGDAAGAAAGGNSAGGPLFDAFAAGAPLLAGLNWLTWLGPEERRFGDPAAVVQRMARLVRRAGAA